jgi:hypothetical protein
MKLQLNDYSFSEMAVCSKRVIPHFVFSWE